MRILLDLDEVITDLVGGFCVAFNVPREKVYKHWPAGEYDNNSIPPISKAKGFPTVMTDEFFWSFISQKGEAFWMNLQPLPWAHDLLNLVTSMTDDWHIVSSPVKCPTCYDGKVKWLKKFFGPDFDRFALTPHKSIFAQPGVLLIDDRESNCEEFIAAGGQAILFPTHHNSLHRYKHDPITHVRNLLEDYKDAPTR